MDSNWGGFGNREVPTANGGDLKRGGNPSLGTDMIFLNVCE